MESPRSELAPRPRYLTFTVLFGIALLAASMAGAKFVESSDPPEVAPTPAPTTTGRVRTGTSLGYVDVEAGVSALYPIQPGRVTKIHARDNTDVEANAPLFEMDSTHARIQVVKAKAALDASKAQLELAEQLPAQHDSQVNAQKSAVAAKRSELAAAKAKRDKVTRLVESKAAGTANDTREAQAAVNALESAVEAEEFKLEGLKRINPKGKIDQARADVAGKQAQLEEAEFSLKECTLVAPVKGKVLRMLVAVGEALGSNPRQPAVYFCPDTPRVVRAEIEQEFASQFSPRDAVTIADDSSRGQKWTGKVKRMGDWFTHRRSILQEPLQLNDVRTLECIIEVDGGGKDLRIGQRVRVSRAN